jgi:hypothetical protein
MTHRREGPRSVEASRARRLGIVIARIVSGPARGHRPDQKEDEGDDQETPDGVDRGADAAADDHAHDDPDNEDREDPEDDVSRGGRLTEAAAHLLDLRVSIRLSTSPDGL